MIWQKLDPVHEYFKQYFIYLYTFFTDLHTDSSSMTVHYLSSKIQ